MSGPTLAEIVVQGAAALQAQYGKHLRGHHHQALRAIAGCRSGAFGELHLQCTGCEYEQLQPRSCGHRSCPQCQFHTTRQWLERQRAKLLPVNYFMITFTLPAELRGVAKARPKRVYDALFQAACGTLKSFGLNHKLQVQLGLCAVLHTHSRKLDYHPHLHVIVPGGGIDVKRRQWKKFQGKYLFNARQLAAVYRARLLQALDLAGIDLPRGIRDQWVVDCRNVGNGAPALDYLSRYLYRGVIHNHQIDACDPVTGSVRFHYTDAQTQRRAERVLPIAEFLWLLLQHVLPPGYHRVREYGFVHANAAATLRLVHWVLKVLVPAPVRPPSGTKCRLCHCAMRVTRVVFPRQPAT
jgi:hypothetical protein